jgi:hypothetical protein
LNKLEKVAIYHNVRNKFPSNLIHFIHFLEKSGAKTSGSTFEKSGAKSYRFLIDFLLGIFAPLFSKKWKKLNVKTRFYLNVP